MIDEVSGFNKGLFKKLATSSMFEFEIKPEFWQQ